MPKHAGLTGEHRGPQSPPLSLVPTDRLNAGQPNGARRFIILFDNASLAFYLLLSVIHRFFTGKEYLMTARQLPPSWKKVAIIGGGNGPYMVGSGLRDQHVNIAILSTPADSGGHSGRIRNEMGEMLPPGDIRRGMMALMDSKYAAQFRQYFDHRLNMEDPNDDGKMSLGNILIAGAIDVFGRIEGLKFIEELFHVRGTVLPMSIDNVHLYGRLDDGTTLEGETNIDLRSLDDPRILTDVWLEPNAYIGDDSAQELLEADMITFGPGDLFTSIAPNQKVRGVTEVLAESKALMVAIPSLMTKWSETRDYQVHDFVGKMLEFGIGRKRFDTVLVNNESVPQEILEKYLREEKSTPMLIRDRDDAQLLKGLSVNVQRSDLLSRQGLKRGYIRHDPRKVARELMDILYSGNSSLARPGA